MALAVGIVMHRHSLARRLRFGKAQTLKAAQENPSIEACVIACGARGSTGGLGSI